MKEYVKSKDIKRRSYITHLSYKKNKITPEPVIEEPETEPDNSEELRKQAEEEKRIQDAFIEKERLEKIRQQEEADRKRKEREEAQRKKDEEARQEKARQDAERKREEDIKRQREENERLRRELEAEVHQAEIDAEAPRLSTLCCGAPTRRMCHKLPSCAR